MTKVFLDSSVLVAACASKEGASAYILGLCQQGVVKGFISREVVNEAHKNVVLKLGETARQRLRLYLRKTNLEIALAPTEEIVRCELYIYPKDAPILAAALSSSASFLVTLDKKHFLKSEVVKFAHPLVILTPGELIRKHLLK